MRQRSPGDRVDPNAASKHHLGPRQGSAKARCERAERQCSDGPRSSGFRRLTVTPIRRAMAAMAVPASAEPRQTPRVVSGRWRPVEMSPTEQSQKRGDAIMGRGLILWLVGIPLPVILLLYFLGYLH